MTKLISLGSLQHLQKKCSTLKWKILCYPYRHKIGHLPLENDDASLTCLHHLVYVTEGLNSAKVTFCVLYSDPYVQGGFLETGNLINELYCYLLLVFIFTKL